MGGVDCCPSDDLVRKRIMGNSFEVSCLCGYAYGKARPAAPAGLRIVINRFTKTRKNAKILKIKGRENCVVETATT